MSSTAAVVQQVIATATIATPRGTSAAVAMEQVATATAAAAQGLAGPPGPPGIAAAIVHTQTAASASWIIPHTLGRMPLVQVFDEAGALVITDVTASPSTVSIVFAQAIKGSAILF